MPRVVTVTKTDGTVERFEETREMPAVSYVIGFVIVRDGYGREISIPTSTVTRIETDPPNRSW